MDIQFTQVGRRYKFDWIFKNIDFKFTSGKVYAIKGPNGSGKSTLLKILSGQLSPSKGEVIFIKDGKNLETAEVYKHVSFAGPYIDLIEELNLEELIDFHFKFKKAIGGISKTEIIELLDLKQAAQKEIQFYSSGMKQRVKLGLSILSERELLLLDEPATNLDQAGQKWFQQLLKKYKKYTKDRLVIIASNEASDFELCTDSIDIRNYKRS